MATRIALTLAGGVSLGAYQAGATYELLWALAHRLDPSEPVFIDVLTGASAGAMNAAVLARALLYDRAAADELYRAWVKDVSAADLLEGQPPASFFSDRPIRDLVRRVLEAPPVRTHPHPAEPADLRMALTLSNLNGINYALGYANVPGGFDTTIFSDWIALRLGRDAPDVGPLPEVWASIARAATASGAFPFAFPTVRVRRRLADYARSEIYDPDATREFTYVDGGLFNNEPVGLAREMVEGLEAADPRIERDRRIHILVDPYVGSNAAVVDFPEGPLGYRLLFARLLDAVLGEASKRDWIRASRTNTRLRWQDELLMRVAEAVADVPARDLAAYANRVAGLAREIAAVKVAYQNPDDAPTEAAVRAHLERNIERLGPILCGDAYAEIRGTPACADAFLNIAYVLENVAGLRKKVDLDLHLIAPTPGSLAGDFFFNFGGFFVEEWREHDWRRGRADARRVLERLSNGTPGLRYTPDVATAYVPERDLGQVGGAEIPRDAQFALRRKLKEEVVRLILPKPTGLLVRWLVTLMSGYVANKAVDALVRRTS
ncbi:MAG: patatin-like phospholipase family protein [Armatimonadota bacterium]